MRLPPAQSEIYDGPHPEWLRDILEQLPNLQSLFVSQLPFFDHHALQKLRYHSHIREQERENPSPIYGLRLIVAAQCPNTTSLSLSEALGRLPNVVFLDFSRTTAVRDPTVLAKLGLMPSLQVLKLREIGLKDEDLETTARAVGLRIRSLDVRGNLLTDRSAKILRRWCLKESSEDDGLQETLTQPTFGIILDDWPSGIARPDLQLLDDFRSDALDEHFIKYLATATVTRLPSEDLPNSGITHLYISNNYLTIDGLIELMVSKRLFVLDAGNLCRLQRPRSSISSVLGESDAYEKLIPLLEKCCSSNLTSLRLHHDIVVKNACEESDPPPVAFEMSSQDARAELSGRETTHELGVSANEPRYELYGDSTQVVITPAVGEAPALTAAESVTTPNRGPAFAPEVMETNEVDDAPVLTATGLIYSAQAVNGVNALQTSTALDTGIGELTSLIENPDLRVTLIEQQEREFDQALRNKPHSLLPAMLPRLRTLTLTDVPCRDFTHDVVDSLIRFISYCAKEAEFASLHVNALQAREGGYNAQSPISQVPVATRDYFALSRIVLEMGPPDSSNLTIQSPSIARATSARRYRTKSSTEDADSEALWSAQENDFSFFDDDEEECGLPAQEGPQSWHMLHPAILSEKHVVVAPSPTSLQDPETERATQQPQPQPKSPIPGELYKPKQKRKLMTATMIDSALDVVQEIAKFRRERKLAYEEGLKHGKRFVDGHWSGKVKVARWQAPRNKGGLNSELDWDFYGNYYSEKGIYR